MAHTSSSGSLYNQEHSGTDNPTGSDGENITVHRQDDTGVARVMVSASDIGNDTSVDPGDLQVEENVTPKRKGKHKRRKHDEHAGRKGKTKTKKLTAAAIEAANKSLLNGCMCTWRSMPLFVTVMCWMLFLRGVIEEFALQLRSVLVTEAYLKLSEVEFLAGLEEFGVIIALLFVSLYASRMNKPLAIFAGSVIVAISYGVFVVPPLGLARPEAIRGPALSLKDMSMYYVDVGNNTACRDQIFLPDQKDGVFSLFSLSRILTGIGSSFLYVPGLLYIHDNMGEVRIPVAFGLVLGAGGIGRFAGAILGEYVPNQSFVIRGGTWPYVFIVAGGLVLLSSLLFLPFPAWTKCVPWYARRRVRQVQVVRRESRRPRREQSKSKKKKKTKADRTKKSGGRTTAAESTDAEDTDVPKVDVVAENSNENASLPQAKRAHRKTSKGGDRKKNARETDKSEANESTAEIAEGTSKESHKERKSKEESRSKRRQRERDAEKDAARRRERKRRERELEECELTEDQKSAMERRRRRIPFECRNMMSIVWKTMRNGTFILSTLSLTILSLMFHGYYSSFAEFLDLEYQKPRPSVSSNILSGVCIPLFASVGMVIGGYLGTNYKIKAHKLVFMSLLSVFIATVALAANMAIGCGNRNLNSTVNAQSFEYAFNCKGWQVGSQKCARSVFVPVCREDTQTTYPSPCHAGCLSNSTNPSNGVLTGCQCGGPWSFGACRGSCELLVVVCLLTSVASLFAGIAFIPPILIILRCTEEREKYFALGFAAWIMSLLAHVPGPALFRNAIIYSTCLLWRDGTCSMDQEICWDHDLFRLRLLYNGVMACFLLFGGLLLVIIYFKLKRVYSEKGGSTPANGDAADRLGTNHDEPTAVVVNKDHEHSANGVAQGAPVTNQDEGKANTAYVDDVPPV